MFSDPTTPIETFFRFDLFFRVGRSTARDTEKQTYATFKRSVPALDESPEPHNMLMPSDRAEQDHAPIRGAVT